MLFIFFYDYTYHLFEGSHRTVLGHWGIHDTEDLGEIVFVMVECGVLIKREEDRREDFRGLFDFEEVFERDYPWGGHF